MMGSLKALQEWCRIQCEDYNDVEIKNMSTSFRDGLAFCAIIHRYRPDLIDFDSLSKENVYENNRLAFEVAETQLGIPALLDPEDMVSMKVPDRLSIITYVSQYYNFFTNKSEANPPCMKRPSATGHTEPAQKRPTTPLEDKMVESERSTLSSTCAACQKHVHLVQRFLVDGKLYHRNCFRCAECCSTLLPGSYKLGSDSGVLVCTHHFTRPAFGNQNGRPDLSKRPAGVQSARTGSTTAHETPPSERDQEKTPPPGTDFSHFIHLNHVIVFLCLDCSSMYSICVALHVSIWLYCVVSPSVNPPNLLCVSLSSLSSGTHKPKDPPWLALVQSEPKKKQAPPPPPAGLATPPNTGSLSSLKGEGSRPSTPPPPSNPFEEEEEDDNIEVEEEEGTEGTEATGADTPPSGGSSSRSRICKENPFNRKASPSPAKSKARPPQGSRPARPPAPGHGFPLIKRKVQSDQYIPVEDIHGEMSQLEKELDELEQRGVELERKLRDNPNDEEEEHLLVDWFTLIHEKHLLVRREAELVYTAKQQNLEERQADVEYELRCLLNKPEKEWSEEDKSREKELMAELVTIIEQRNQIINNMDQDRQREEEEDKFMEAMLKKKDFHKDSDSEQQKKKGAKFKPMKVLKRLSHKGEPSKSQSPRKEKS
uniref:MICAL-like 1a n=1 Tax=Myripristis murdjan TaxID=586833 RepID=A0A668AJ81_9TELE